MRVFRILFTALYLSSLQVTVVAPRPRRKFKSKLVQVHPREEPQEPLIDTWAPRDASREQRRGAIVPGDDSYENLNFFVNVHAIDYYAGAVISYNRAIISNRANAGFAGAQLIAGVAAFSLGVTMTVVTAGGAVVPIAIAFAVASVGGAVSGAGARVAEHERNANSNILETRSNYVLVRGWQHAKKKVNKVKDGVVNKLGGGGRGAAKLEAAKAGGIAGAKEGATAAAVEIGIEAGKETASAALSGVLNGVAGAAGGALSAVTGGFALKDAYDFSEKAEKGMFEPEYWDNLGKNLANQGFDMSAPEGETRTSWAVFYNQLDIFAHILQQMQRDHVDRKEFIQPTLNRVYGALRIAKKRKTPGIATKALNCVTPKCLIKKASNRVAPAPPSVKKKFRCRDNECEKAADA